MNVLFHFVFLLFSTVVHIIYYLVSFRSDDGQEKHNKRFPNLFNLSSKSNTEKQWVEKMSCKTLHRHTSGRPICRYISAEADILVIGRYISFADKKVNIGSLTDIRMYYLFS